MPALDGEGNRTSYVVGWGYIAYVFCCLAALVRASTHYLTPMSGGGAGLRCIDKGRRWARGVEDLDASSLSASCRAHFAFLDCPGLWDVGPTASPTGARTFFFFLNVLRTFTAPCLPPHR